MLFTKSTENGIQLENAMILTPEQLKKATIPANEQSIKDWAKENHVNVRVGIEEQSDFNFQIGMTCDEYVSENVMASNKALLRRAAKELIDFIDKLPTDTGEKSSIDDSSENEINELAQKFIKGVKGILGPEAIVLIHIGRPVGPEKLAELIEKGAVCMS